MSETRSQQEPSMEEILASIRRIISEDGQEPQSEAKPDRPEMSEPRLTQPAQGDEKPAHEEAERPRLRAVASGEAEILVLTEMVADDGSVVSLAAQSPAATDLSMTPESVGLPEPPAGTPGDSPGGPDAVERKMPPALDERGPERPESDQPGPSRSESVQPESSQLESSQLEPDQPEPDQPKPTQKIPAETVEQSKAETAGLQAEMVPAIETDDRMESETMSNDARKKLELVSQEAEAASTAAIAELARTVSRETPIDGGRSVEDLVREALKPMLRQWLDANLPDLVERVVRAEIQRMVRRAEDKA